MGERGGGGATIRQTNRNDVAREKIWRPKQTVSEAIRKRQTGR